MRAALRCPLFVALVLLLAPAGAAAAPAREQMNAPAQMRAMVRERTSHGARQPASRQSFRLESQNGYLLEVAGSGDNVVIYVVRGRKASSVTAYVARGTVTRNRLQASFGKFGKVSMRFRQSSKQTSSKPNRVCKGAGRFIDRSGTYSGEFSFRGEGGYVSVHARRARGKVTSVAPQCERGHSAQRLELSTHPSQGGIFGESERPYLLSSRRSGVSSASFLALKEKKPIFVASAEEDHGKFAIFRLALGDAPSAKALKISNALTSARVSPPAPFSGTGNYRATPDGTKHWTGSLAVNFPGAAHYSLTAPPFEAEVETTTDPFFFFYFL